MYTRNEKIVPRYIEEEVKDSYLNYAMSVIVGRALPDVRDGLKPVHRRVLYTMKELNLEHDKPYKKCARVVGDCMGRFHPHGDVAIYDTLVRMAQDFSLRYPLVEGQGNFGCFTKDTKVRLTNGRSFSFAELIEEARQGKKNYTFTFNHKSQKIEIAEIKNPRKTRRNAEIIKVVLDNGEKIKCTPDHLFMLRDGTYKKAKDIRSRDSLMPVSQQGHNHKAIAVGNFDIREDVYDLTIEPWHNFLLDAGIFVHNSIDNDPPAAQRYTEARLSAISDEMLADIDKETVNFMPNFDASLVEPTILPALLPNLLVNGSSGIAVGMATNMPPHNLSEIIDGIIYAIDNPDCEVKDLVRYIKGPDFPTGGLICGRQGIKDAYSTGKGKLTLRARASIERQKQGKDTIIITEIPYQANKASIIESIAGLVEEKKIEGIADIRDESDKEGLRIVVELRRDSEPQIVLNQLFKHTQLEVTFGIINLALVDRRPRILNLKQLVSHYILHRKDIIRRRTIFDLEKAKHRAHILEGLKIALKFLDRVIKTIKTSKNVAVAKAALIKNFDLSDVQAQAILEMQLQRLTALERDKIDAEYLELIKKIELYQSILASEKKIETIIKEDLQELKKKYGDERLTEIAAEAEEIEIEDLIAEEDVVITISHSGYLKRLPVSGYRKQKRGGKGATGAELREEDFIEHLFVASTKDYLLVFTDKGRVYWLKVYEIPQASRVAKGKAIINLLQLASDEKISSTIPVKEFAEDKFLVMATKAGLIKKTQLNEYSNPRKGGIIGITIEKGDELIEVKLTDGKQELLLATRLGKAIRFPETGVRDMGRQAKGVRGIGLSKNDEVIAMGIVRKEDTVLTVTELGFAKRTLVEQYRIQRRGGKGIINMKVTKKNGQAVGLKVVSGRDELMVMTQNGMFLRCLVKDIRATGRSAQGVRLIKLSEKDRVSSVAHVIVEEE